MEQIIPSDQDVQIDSQTDSQQNSQNFTLKVKVLNEQIRKEAIKEYGKIYQETRNIDKDRHDFGEIMDKLQSSVNKENSCLSRFGINELLTLDAKNIALASEFSYELAKKFEIVDKFNTKQYLKKLRENILRNLMKSNIGEIDPSQRLQLVHLYPFGEKYRNLHYSVPYLKKSVRSAPENADQSVKTRRNPVHKLPTGEAKKPKQYNTNDAMNKVDKSDERLEHIFTSLQKLEKRNTGAVPFLQASINPKNFAVTVENIFNLSFLARQSRLIIDYDDDEITGEPCVRTKEPDNPENEPEGDVIDTTAINQNNLGKDNVQSVFSFDRKSYEEIISKLEINRPAFK